MRFKPGQKVLVKTSGYNPDDMVIQMRRFIGKVVTISSNNDDGDWSYRIDEDLRWVWREDFFTYSGESADPNFMFKLKKSNLRR